VSGLMAVWEVRVVYAYGDRSWENVWHVDTGADTDVDPALILQFADTAKELLLSLYTVNRIARRPLGSHDEFIETVFDLVGGIAIGGNKALPLFNVARVILAGGVGRPGLKSLRGLLTSSDIIDSANHISATLVSLIQEEMSLLFNAASDAGQQIVFGEANKVAVSPLALAQVFGRQQHRKRKKTV
jgi:hypothetical protein